MRSRSSLRAFALAAAFATGLGAAGASPASAACDCPLTFARLGTQPLVLMNASTLVADIVRDRTPDAEARDRIERAALQTLAAEIKSVPRGTKQLTLRVLYDKIGDVSPIYGAATFAGVERYGILQLDGPSLIHDRNRWEQLRSSDAIPSWVTFTVVGSLPDR